MRCQEVRNGEIMEIITTTNTLVTVAIMVTATNNNNTVPKKQTSQTVDTKARDSKITLTQESDHYVPTEFSGNFFRQFDLAMKLKCDELKKQGGGSNQVNELTENNFIQAFSVTENQMEKAASMLSRNENTEKWEIRRPD